MRHILIISFVFILLLPACGLIDPTSEPIDTPFDSPSTEVSPTTAPTPKPNPLAEEIIGIWIYANHTYQQYNDDGTYSWAWTEFDLEEGTVDRGTFTMEGNILSLHRDPDSPIFDREDCSAIETGAYEVEIGQWGEMIYGLISDPCHDIEEAIVVRSAPFEKAILGVYRAKNDPNYWMLLTGDGYICDGNSMDEILARTHCNSYSLEERVLTETCEVGMPSCTLGDICRAEVILDKYNVLSYRIDAMACGIYSHIVTDPALPELFIHVYPRD